MYYLAVVNDDHHHNHNHRIHRKKKKKEYKKGRGLREFGVGRDPLFDNEKERLKKRRGYRDRNL